MQWKFWSSGRPQVLSESVKKSLVSQFRLNYQDMGNLRLVAKPGRFASRPVRFIRIFDPALIADGRANFLTYKDLREGNYRKAMLFEGHIEKEGQVFLADRRPPSATTAPVTSNPPKAMATPKK